MFLKNGYIYTSTIVGPICGSYKKGYLMFICTYSGFCGTGCEGRFNLKHSKT